MPYIKKFYGLSNDEKKVLALKKLNEGKTFDEVNKEIEEESSLIVQNELKVKREIKEYKENNQELIFRDEFRNLWRK